MKLVLTNITPPVEYPLFRQKTVVGSDATADIQLHDGGILPQHLIIWQNRGMFALDTAHSAGNVLVNQIPAIQGQPLWPGDVVIVGKTRFIFAKDNVTIQSADGKPVTASWEIASTTALQQLDTINPAQLEKLRQYSPTLHPVTGLRDFLRQGLTHAYNRKSKGLFGALFILPAIGLTAYRMLRAGLFKQTAEQAFPEGMWQFYTQFGLREDAARHANETTGFHSRIPLNALPEDQAAAWVFQAITCLFEYESLLENEWIERTLLRLVHEAVVETITDRIVTPTNPAFPRMAKADRIAARHKIWQTHREQIEIETETYKQTMGLANLEWAWVKKRPYRKPPNHPHETYPQYRRKLFLEFLVEATEKLSPQMGAVVWDNYYTQAETALPAYQQQMSILYSLVPGKYQDTKIPVPLWQAKIGFISGGRYYLLNVAHRDARGRLLVFKPGKPDDPGESLNLQYTPTGDLYDQQGRQIIIDRKGNVTLITADGNRQIKVLRPTPARQIKAAITAILHETDILPPDTSTVDTMLAAAPRAAQTALIGKLSRANQLSLEAFTHVPILINWDQQPRCQTLQQIRSSRRGIGSHALTIFHTETSFVFDQSHIFFDAIWGMILSQIITDGAIDTYYLMAHLSRSAAHTSVPAIVHLQTNPAFAATIKPYLLPAETTAETRTASLALLNQAREHLSRININATVNDLLIIYRILHDYAYTPNLELQRHLAQLREKKHAPLVNQIEAMWQQRKQQPISLLLPMDASFIDPRLRLYPATFKNFLPDFATLYETTIAAADHQRYHPSPQNVQRFLDQRNLLIAHLLVLTEYFEMLKQITRQGQSISTAAIKYLAHLPAGLQDTLDAIPQHIGELNEIIKGEEVFSNVGRVAPASSLVRFNSAKDDGTSKMLVWGIMSDSRNHLKISLRDFRPHVAALLKLGEGSLAQLITQDYLEAYATGLNHMAEDLIKILTTPVLGAESKE